jgi:uncharacterized protein
MDSDLQTLVSTVVAVFLEAAPFLLLGSLITAFFEVYLPREQIRKYLPRQKPLGIFFALFAGMLLPTCECGVVSIVRRLLKNEVPEHIAITYMLAAPVINPLVLLATYVAFQGNVWMVVGRAGIVAFCAAGLGWLLSNLYPNRLMREKQTDGLLSAGPCREVSGLACEGPENHSEGGCGNGLCETIQTEVRWVQIFLHTASEFMDMGKYVVLAGILVGLLKIFLPQEALLLFRENSLLAVGAMMFLAILLSVCSEADAFVAAAFSTFPAVARLAFVCIGPMVDIKLIFMYGSVFRLPVVLTLIVVPTLLVYCLSAFLGCMVR